jgi:transcriptional regulator with GAF, ATPase, and Fis domain
LYLEEEIQAEHNYEQMVGQSPAFRAVQERVRLVAGTETAVLILGETGTGKELIARAVHAQSKRKDRPLIKVYCAGRSLQQLETELFGRESGTSGGYLHLGRLELAHGGTIFLDEIGELPPEIQSRLLRVLQEREFDRGDGGAPVKVNVRWVAATNRDLRRAVREKQFREDFFNRLNAFPIQLPPLRDRREDLPLLTQHFVRQFATRFGKRIESISQTSLHRLAAYPWPGNVRELANVLERSVLLAQGPTLEVRLDTLPAPAPSPLPAAEPVDLATLERNHIRVVLEHTRWVIDGPHGAARLLGLHPNTLRSRLKRLGLQRPSPEAS